MTDDDNMRFRLQQVLAYRQLQASVRSGASHTLMGGLVWLGLAALLFNNNFGFVAAYIALGCAELAIGVWKRLWPSLEAVLADGLVLVGFGLFVLGRQLLAWQGIIFFPVNPISIFLGIWFLFSSRNSFKAYSTLRRAFPDRPSAEIVAWFDDLIYEIRHSDPGTDDQALDLPSKPPWKAKLLGTTAFFVSKKGNEVVIAGPFDFGLAPEDHHEGESHVRVRLHLYDRATKPFDLDDASWANYRKWMASHSNRTPS